MANTLVFFKKMIQKFLDIALPQAKEVQFLEHADYALIAAHLRKARKNLPNCISIFDYQDPLVKTLVWQIKFKGNQHLSEMAARLLYEHLLEELVERALFNGGAQPLLVPVPLAPKRLAERGFNQAARIARLMEKIDGGKNFSVADTVLRVKETKSQTQTRNREERQENMRGAFQVIDPRAISGKHIFVIDDVTTTGSTIGEMKKVLLEAGAKSVTGFTLAH